MGTIRNLHQWSTTHHPRWLVVLRIGLGLALFFKGISFISNSVPLNLLLEKSIFSSSSGWLPLAISWAHLLGGFLIIVGLFTRLAVLLQIPILAGAIIFVNTRSENFQHGSEMGFSLLILLMLIFFLVEGSGPLSLDNYFQKNPR